MRLIDADKFKQEVAAITFRDNLVVEKRNALCKLIDKQPTAYDVDKVVEQLRGAVKTMMPVLNCDEAVKIVKGGGMSDRIGEGEG